MIPGSARGWYTHTLLAAVLLAGCPRAVPPLTPLPRVQASSSSASRRAVLLERLRVEDAQFRTLTIVHSIRLTTRERSSGVLRGALAVRRPDAYRLRLLGPAGVTAMDLVYRAGRFVLTIPSRDVRLVGDPSTPRSSLRGLPVDGLARAFLRRFGGAPAELREDARWSVLVWRGPQDGRREVFVDRRTGLVRLDSTHRGGRETMRLTYGGYRRVGGVRLPFQIRFDLPSDEVRAAIEVERYTLNPTLPERAFELGEP